MDDCDSWEDMEASASAPALASKLNANTPAFSFNPFAPSFTPRPPAVGFGLHTPHQVSGLPESGAAHTPLHEDASVPVAAGAVNVHEGPDSVGLDFVPEGLQNMPASIADSFGDAQLDDKEVGFQNLIEKISDNNLDAVDVKEASTWSEAVNRRATGTDYSVLVDLDDFVFSHVSRDSLLQSFKDLCVIESRSHGVFDNKSG